MADYSPGRDIYLGRRTIPEVINDIARISEVSANRPKVQALAEQFRGSRQPEREVFDFAYKNVVYRQDKNGQRLRHAERSLREGIGNCTDYTILQSALLKNLDIPHYYRVVDDGGHKERGLHHIYIITEKGIVLDPVFGQKQNDKDSFWNRDGGHFNIEAEYIEKKDFMPRTFELQGGRRRTGGTDVYGDIIPITSGTRRSINVYKNAIRNGNLPVQINGGVYASRMAKLGDAVQDALVAEQGMTKEEQEQLKEGLKVAKNIIFGDKCKRNCDINHVFNKEKRQLCKCVCSNQNHTGFSKVDCWKEYGIPTFEWPAPNGQTVLADNIFYVYNNDGWLAFRLKEPRFYWNEAGMEGTTLFGIGYGADGFHNIKKVDLFDKKAYWITTETRWPSSIPSDDDGIFRPKGAVAALGDVSYNPISTPGTGTSPGGGGSGPFEWRPPGGNGNGNGEPDKPNLLIPAALAALLFLG